jgi:hypothetical protein
MEFTGYRIQKMNLTKSVDGLHVQSVVFNLGYAKTSYINQSETKESLGP